MREPINITLEFKQKPLPLMELWNPTMGMLDSLEPILKQNLTICFIWVYGELDAVEDFSGLDSDRFVVPVWLGRNKEEAMSNYHQFYIDRVSGCLYD